GIIVGRQRTCQASARFPRPVTTPNSTGSGSDRSVRYPALTRSLPLPVLFCNSSNTSSLTFLGNRTDALGAHDERIRQPGQLYDSEIVLMRAAVTKANDTALNYQICAYRSEQFIRSRMEHIRNFKQHSSILFHFYSLHPLLRAPWQHGEI